MAASFCEELWNEFIDFVHVIIYDQYIIYLFFIKIDLKVRII